MQSIRELKCAVNASVPRGKSRCFFVKDNAKGIGSYMDLVELAMLPNQNQRIYITTRPFPKTIDVEEFTDRYPDGNGTMINFVPQGVRPILHTYGYIYLQEDLAEKPNSKCGRFAFLLLFVLLLFWLLSFAPNH